MRHILAGLGYLVMVLLVTAGSAAIWFFLLAAAAARYSWLENLGLGPGVALLIGFLLGSLPAFWLLDRVLTMCNYPLPGFRTRRVGFPVIEREAKSRWEG